MMTYAVDVNDLNDHVLNSFVHVYEHEPVKVIMASMRDDSSLHLGTYGCYDSYPDLVVETPPSPPEKEGPAQTTRRKKKSKKKTPTAISSSDADLNSYIEDANREREKWMSSRIAEMRLFMSHKFVGRTEEEKYNKRLAAGFCTYLDLVKDAQTFLGHLSKEDLAEEVRRMWHEVVPPDEDIWSKKRATIRCGRTTYSMTGKSRVTRHAHR